MIHIRPRRLRTTPAMRRLVREVEVRPSQLVLPMFVAERRGDISSMPGVVRHGLDSLRAAAEEAVAALQAMSAPTAHVLRGGKPQMVAAREVVPGDILLIEEGDTLAADARVIESISLRVAVPPCTSCLISSTIHCASARSLFASYTRTGSPGPWLVRRFLPRRLLLCAMSALAESRMLL